MRISLKNNCIVSDPVGIHTSGSIVHTLYYGATFDTFPEIGFTVVNKLNMKLVVNVCFGLN